MIGVVGAGAFGTALACAWSGNGGVVLWGRDAEAMRRLRDTREAPRLPGVVVPEGVRPTADAEALAACETLVLAVPTQALPGVLAALPALGPGHAVAACKGIDLATLRGPTAAIREALPGATSAILSGPSFAADIARGLPTALTLGCADDAAGAAIQAALARPALRLYRETDVTGVELGGALKNVVALACGAAMGAGLGESARAACMTRGLAETVRLATALGARADTLMGLSGLGDLALTCTSTQSRNTRLGEALGRGGPRPEATTEGVPTTRAALALADRHGVDMPVAAAVASLLDGTADVAGALGALLSRDLTTER